MQEAIATLKSAHLQNERTIWVRPPRDEAVAKNLTVFLDAELYRDRVGAVEVIDELHETVADSWFVFVSMHSVEARWVECPCYLPFARFVVDELLPWLASRYPAIGLAQQRTLVGLSYTGLAATFIAKEFPDVFQRVISQSGSYWWNDCWLTEQYRSAAPHATEYYLDVGKREVQENVQHRPDVLQVVSQVDGVRRFRDVLLERGHEVHYVEFDGAHDCADWRRTLPDALRWALPMGEATVSAVR